VSGNYDRVHAIELSNLPSGPGLRGEAASLSNTTIQPQIPLGTQGLS